MWVYEIPTGNIFGPVGDLIDTGYAGAPGHKNVLADVGLKDEGPIPPGWYTMANWRDDPHEGPYTASLVPDDTNEMYGRAGFNWHGDSIEHAGCGSKGCICSSRKSRQAAAESPDHRLYVCGVWVSAQPLIP
jgi:hypothetical protein